MTKEAGVAVIPLSPFYQKQESQPIIRVCFAKTDEVLKKAAGILSKL
jgi:methionine aminotransferase